jgi:hypothetical protein
MSLMVRKQLQLYSEKPRVAIGGEKRM